MWGKYILALLPRVSGGWLKQFGVGKLKVLSVWSYNKMR